jgi:hypothetical protein
VSTDRDRHGTGAAGTHPRGRQRETSVGRPAFAPAATAVAPAPTTPIAIPWDRAAVRAPATPAPGHRETARSAHGSPAPPPVPVPVPWAPGPVAVAAAGGPPAFSLVLLTIALMAAASLLGPAAPGGRLAMTAVRRLRVGSSRLERPG